MKITLSFLASLSLLFVLIAADAAPEAVRDIAGKQLRYGTEYYILPVFRGMGGGLVLTSAGNESCPLKVAQDQLEVSPGFPLTFHALNPKKGVVRVSTDLNVKVAASSTCVQSTVWKLGSYDESTGQYFITAGGVEGNPGPATTSNWFKIEKYENDYKLVFCPTVCNFCKVICKDIGIYIMEEKRLLALSEKPFKVMFRKA